MAKEEKDTRAPIFDEYSMAMAAADMAYEKGLEDFEVFPDPPPLVASEIYPEELLENRKK